MVGLNEQVAKGVIWTMGLRITVRAVAFVSTVILARLLTPEDFGLVAIIMSFFSLIDIFGDFGFDTVLIQKQNATIDHYHTAWSFNVTFGVVSCITVIGLSGIISDFYGNTKLQPIMLALSLLFLFNGFLNIGVVDFRKNMTFDKEFKFQIIPKLISFFCTIGLAFWLRNYWALVIGALVWKSCILINSYILHRFRPKFTFSSGKDLFNFSKWLIINNFLNFVNTRSPEMIIGKILSPQATGLFTIAQEISTIPTVEIAATVNRASYPGYSKISHQPEKLKDLYINIMSSISLIVIPAGVGVASIAGTLVPVVLGAQWHESIVLVQYLAIGGLLLALNSNTGFVFIAMGKPKISCVMDFLRILILIPLLIGLPMLYGLEGVALATLWTTMVTFCMYSSVIHLKLKIPWRRILTLHFRPATASIAMWLCVKASQPLLYELYNQKEILVLISMVFIGVFVYGLSILLLWIFAGQPWGPERKIIEYSINQIGKSKNSVGLKKAK